MNQKQDSDFAFFHLLKFIGSFLIAIFLHYNDHFLTYLYTPNPFQPDSIWFKLSHQSYVFVEMYFIISGILFVLAYQSRIENGLPFKAFLLGRIRRIYPLLIITSIFMYLANFLILRNTGSLWSCGSTNPLDLLWNVLLGGTSIFHGNKTLNGPVWYISVLMLCYLICFVISKYAKEKSIYIYTFLILLGLVMRFSRLQYPLWNEDVARGLIAYFMGTVLAICIQLYQTRLKSKMTTLNQTEKTLANKLVKILYRIFLSVLFVFAFILLQKIMYPKGDIYFTSFAAVILFPILILLLYKLTILNRICSTRLIKWLGAISYDLYLWNFPIFITLHLLYVEGYLQVNLTSWKFLIAIAILHIFVAGISNYLLSLPRKLYKKSL